MIWLSSITYYLLFTIIYYSIIGLNLLATLKNNLGDLDKIKRVVKLTGFVNCIDGYGQQPSVINGCSDLMVEIFGPVKGNDKF